MQEEEQRGTAEEVDDDQRRQRPERMEVVGAGKPTGSSQRLPGPHSLGNHRGHGEPGKGEPRECGQDEEPDEQPHRQEDEDSHTEGGHVIAATRLPAEDEHACGDVADREDRSAQEEESPLDGAVRSDRELVEDGDDEPQREPTPEPSLVEPDRVGDELPDGPVGRRDVARNLGHELDRISALSVGRRLKRLDELFLEPREVAVDREVAPA